MIYSSKNKGWIIALLVFGILSMIISYLGFGICGGIGIIGIVKVFTDMNQILEDVQDIKTNLYPLSCIFILPFFYLLIFQFLNYLRMIYGGVNQKVEASILRYNRNAKDKYKIKPMVSVGLMRLVKFFTWRDISPSELTREMTVDAKLEYETPPEHHIEIS